MHSVSALAGWTLGALAMATGCLEKAVIDPRLDEAGTGATAPTGGTQNADSGSGATTTTGGTQNADSGSGAATTTGGRHNTDSGSAGAGPSNDSGSGGNHGATDASTLPKQEGETCIRLQGGDDCDVELVCLDGQSAGICRRSCLDNGDCSAGADCLEVPDNGSACYTRCVPHGAAVCPSGQSCYVAAVMPELLAFCYVVGTSQRGSPCAGHNSCSAGLACASLPDGAQCGAGETQCCARYCTTLDECSNGESCIGFSAGELGFCWATP